eukprot:GHVP01009476.1.p2 GENE.GHVP01009476.1~~GHVP01009476.1.p2  ORF type:complete len:184 (+),score=35.91 GHVP01009476.1:1226-1777(+)
MEIKHLADQFSSALEDFGTPQGTVCCLHDELIPDNNANPLEPEFRGITFIKKVGEVDNKIEMYVKIKDPKSKEIEILKILRSKNEIFKVTPKLLEGDFSKVNFVVSEITADPPHWTIKVCCCFQESSLKNDCPCLEYNVTVTHNHEVQREVQREVQSFKSLFEFGGNASTNESESESNFEKKL